MTVAIGDVTPEWCAQATDIALTLRVVIAAVAMATKDRAAAAHAHDLHVISAYWKASGRQPLDPEAR